MHTQISGLSQITRNDFEAVRVMLSLAGETLDRIRVYYIKHLLELRLVFLLLLARGATLSVLGHASCRRHLLQHFPLRLGLARNPLYHKKVLLFHIALFWQRACGKRYLPHDDLCLALVEL